MKMFVFAISLLKIFSKDVGRYIKSIYYRAKWIRVGVKIDTRVTIDVFGAALMSLMPGVTVRRGALLIASDEKANNVPSGLIIGSRSVINEGANIRGAGGVIKIGEDVLISQYVSIFSSGYELSKVDYWKSWVSDSSKIGVQIGDRVWIGAGAIILPGVTIGNDAVIGAGSVVTKNIPSQQIWAGNPARMISKRLIQ